ncbi:hypothetical protein AQUCO_02800068v1 [Aquilegia coerulea]|uniref:GB1/RHD3-type G domain-containing protein n=1 Tax=Aquilegia coerulea TaxID=218851 RepID=A0A2G5D3Q8_AQUCA|nr:hypothetical protein AQUCO_02800068v1 [Aquilegia coerulea]
MAGKLLIQLIDEDGRFNVTGMQDFANLGEHGISYGVVSIFGPQSSGKSTLLNNLFETKFKEMDASIGRSQTTKGIWLAKHAGINKSCILVIDLEGSDGKERGEDDVCLEKQSALFALAVSDIVLINMWCNDIGRHQAGSRPLLKTIFQVMMRLFQPRRITLLFVIRDKSAIFDSVIKPEAHKKTALTEFFNVEVIALSNYEDKKELFKDEVVSLKQRYIDSIASGVHSEGRRDRVPASAFSLSAQEIWKVIKENKDLNLASNKILVARARCEDISNESFAHLVGNEDWHQLQEAVQSGPVKGFGKKIKPIISKCLSEYDAEAVYFDEGIRTEKRQLLEAKVLQFITPAYQNILAQLHSGALDNFKKAFHEALNQGKQFVVAARDCSKYVMSVFGEGCSDAAIENSNYDSSQVLDRLGNDIGAYVASEITSFNEAKLDMALSAPVKALLDEAGDNTWPTIRNMLREQTKSASSRIVTDISCLDVDQKTIDQILSDIERYARSVVEAKATEASKEVLSRMKDRFSELFNYDSNSKPRTWTGNEDIEAIINTALSASLRLLSVMTAIQLDDDADSIADTLSSALLGFSDCATYETTLIDPLASSTWEKVSSTNTLKTPIECKALWKLFQEEIKHTINQAKSIAAQTKAIAALENAIAAQTEAIAAQESAEVPSTWLAKRKDVILYRGFHLVFHVNLLIRIVRTT